MTNTVRLPAAEIVVLGTPGTAHSTGLTDLLNDAGIDAGRQLHRSTIRSFSGARCVQMSHKMAPAACLHFEDDVTRSVGAYLTGLAGNGGSFSYEPGHVTDDELRVEVARSRRNGLASVALRVGAGVDREQGWKEHQDSRSRAQLTREQFDVAFDADRARTDNDLRKLGFDVVAHVGSGDTLEVMPSGTDASMITADLAVIGDIHGCIQTFTERMLPALGTDEHLSNPDVVVVSIGDIHDKGPHSVAAIRWWLWALRTGRALMTDSNHNKSLVRALTTNGVPIRGPLQATLNEIDAQPDANDLRADIVAFFSRLPSHLVFQDVVCVHAAMTTDKLHRTDAKTRGFALHTRFEQHPWHWHGTQTVVHGHVIVESPTRRRATPLPGAPVPGEVINVDTGAYRGGGLTAWLSRSDTTVTVPTVPGECFDQQAFAAEMSDLVAWGKISPQQADELVGANAHVRV